MNPPLDSIKIVECKTRTEGNYKAFYMIIDVSTWNVEIKVVGDLNSVPESHDWYELRRSKSGDNLDHFIRNRYDIIDNNILNSNIDMYILKHIFNDYFH